MMKLRTSTSRRIAAGLVVALLAASCTGGGDDGDGASTSSTSTSTTTAEPVRTTEPPVPTRDPARDTFVIEVPDPDPTPIDIDSAVRIGTLENGLTYYLRENDSPGGRVELRVAVNAGSLQQDDPESGLAHFVEHMVFNGTDRFPGNEMDKALQDLGLAIGPDVNAFTSFDETVYSLSVAAVPDDVDLAFDIMFEAMTAATIDPDAVVEERGVVREERRSNTESPEGRQFDVFLDAYTIGSDYFGASPIGSAEGILATTAEQARTFYDRWYRPDLMAVVVVGDMPIDRMEAEVRERFTDIGSRGDDRDRAAPLTPPVDDRWVDVLLDPETASRRVSLDYWIPTWHPGTVGGERLIYLESMLGQLIDNRLNDEVDRGNLDAISPFAGPFDLARNIRFLGFNFGGDDLARATEDVVAELRRIEVLGFTDAELARVIEQFAGGLDQFVDGIGTTQDTEYADSYVNHYLAGSEIDEAEATAARLRAILDEVTTDELTNHYRYLMSVTAPLLAALGQEPSDMPTVEELESALDRGLAVEVEDSAARDELEVTELMAAPEPVEPDAVDDVIDLDAVRYEFANGVTAFFIETSISEGEVDLFALSDGGWSVLSQADAQLAALATDAAFDSGLGDLDPVQLNTFLDGSVAALESFIDETEEGFFGNAASDDAELLFQLLHLAITEPRIDTAAFRAAVESAETGLRSAASDPGTLSIIELFDARYGTSELPRIVPSTDAIAGATIDDALRVYEARLGKVDDLVVAVAGDIEASIVTDLFERYLGTLPAGENDTHVDLWPAPPADVIAREVTAGSTAAGAGVDFLFTAEVEISDRSSLVAEVVSNIVRSRLFDSVREDLGASYGASVFVNPSTRPDEVIETFVLANGDPDRLDLIEQTILEALHGLAVDGPSDVELERAKGILSSDYELTSNFDLLSTLVDLGRTGSLDPFTRLEAFRMVEGISADEVTELASAMFPRDRWIQVVRG